jgi:hypothetical protein
VNVERKWVIAAFLDIRDFRIWTMRAAVAQEFQSQFFERFYDGLQLYVKKHVDAWSKYEGDGILTVKEFTPAERSDPKKVEAFLLTLRFLLRKAWSAIHESEFAPNGVRIRIMGGMVSKYMLIDPNDPERIRRIAEYVGYCTNSLKGLLGVNPEVPALATDNVCQLLPKRSVLRGKPHRNPSCYPKGLNKEDVDVLWNLNF